MTARLVGGPYDGDAGVLIVDPPPSSIWVTGCANPECADHTHWWCDLLLEADEDAVSGKEGER